MSETVEVLREQAVLVALPGTSREYVERSYCTGRLFKGRQVRKALACSQTTQMHWAAIWSV